MLPVIYCFSKEQLMIKDEIEKNNAIARARLKYGKEYDSAQALIDSCEVEK